MSSKIINLDYTTKLLEWHYLINQIMSFSISQIIVDADKNVVALDWVYKNKDGQLSNQHLLKQPYGDKPLEEVTTPVAMKWLSDQLGNTAEDFDKAIADYKTQREYQQGLSAYSTELRSAPQKIEPIKEEETAEEEVKEDLDVSTMPIEEDLDVSTMPVKD